MSQYNRTTIVLLFVGLKLVFLLVHCDKRGGKNSVLINKIDLKHLKFTGIQSIHYFLYLTHIRF